MPGPEGVTAVVLAGGDAGDELAASGGVAAKALLPVGGRPLASYVLEAIASSGRVWETVYVGPTDQELGGYEVVSVPAGKRFEDSLAFGLGAALGRGATAMLVITADLPWLSGADLARFIDAARALRSDVVYPVVAEEHMTQRFPEQRRTYVKLREGRFTGGNMALLTPTAVPAVLPLVSRAFRARKNPLSMATLAGIGVVGGIASGTARLAALEHRISGLLGVSARALRSEDPALAADVDRLDHLPGVLDPAQPEWRKT